MNKKVLIDKQALIDELMKIPGVGSNSDALETIKRFPSYEPQKPVVPQLVADWFEDNKDDLEFAIWKLTIDSNSNYTKNKNEMRHWIQYAPNKPYKTLIGMLNGYDVEKEPLYIMPVPYIPFPAHYCVEDDHISLRQGNAQKFTQAELDRYFPDIKQFAVPVEEVAEG